jgi:hypothetical protein
MSAFNRFALAAVLLIAMSTFALGQSAVTGAVSGSVTDPSTAVVTNATVTLRSMDTNKEETVTSGGDGRFRFANLQPGLYSIRVSAPGFADFRQEPVTVEVGRTTNIEAALKIGGTTAVVEISAATATVNTDSHEFSSNIDQKQISELPINGRRWSNFAILAPGSVPDGSFGLISFRGISGLLNNNTVDGGDNNQAFFAEERGRTRISYSISQSAIREFQVNTSNYSAEYGRAAGGVTNAVTKSGTNELHGDFFYYQRNNNWGARNPLAFKTDLVNGVATPVAYKPEDQRHQFGGTIGGPIARDRLFFFFSYDQQKRDFPGLSIFSNPNYLNTVRKSSLQAPTRNITDAQINDAITFLQSLSGPVPRRGDQTLILPKIDWQINNKNVFTINYNRLRWDSPAGIQTQGTNSYGNHSFGNDYVKIDWGTARLITTISTKLVNEFRVQIARDFEYQNSQNPAAGEPTTAVNGSVPEVVLTNGFQFGKANFLERAKYPEEMRYQYTDNVSWNIGGSILKFGFDINHVRNTLSNLRYESGSFVYSNIDDFIVDYTNWKTPLASTVNCVNNPTRFRGRCYTSNFQQGFGPLGAELATNDYNFYAQYDWRLFPRLMVNLGLRYEYEALPAAQNPYPTSGVQIPNLNLTLDKATSDLPSNKDNFGPRAGFTWDLTGNGRTSLRGGFGMYYGRIINSTIYNGLVNTGNAAGQSQVSVAPTLSTAPIFPTVLSSAPAGTGAIQFFSPGFKNPLIYQGDLSFQKQIWWNTTVSASYLLSLGRRLPTFIDRNLWRPTQTQSFTITGGPYDGQTTTIPVFAAPRPNTSFSQLTEIESAVNSEYHAMVLEANRRFARSVQFNVSYTLAKAQDASQTSTTFTTNNVPYNAFDYKAEWGRSNFDRRHKFTANAVYAPRVTSGSKTVRVLLDGWSLAPIFQLYTGLPYNGNVSGSFSGNSTVGTGTGAGSLNRSGGANRFPLITRNEYTGPKVINFDLRISRRFYIKERMNVEFFAEAFNLFNRTQVTGLNTTFYTLSGATLNYNSTFGTITEAGGTLYRERQLQLAVRFQF